MRRLLISLLLVAMLCASVSCSNKKPGEVIEKYEINYATHAAAKLDCPDKLISMDKLNDYMFKIIVDGEEFMLSGDNYNGSNPVLYYKNSSCETIYEIDEDGESKVFVRDSGDSDFTEYVINNEDIDYESIETIMHMIGIDYEGFYGPLKFELISEDRYSDIYKTVFDNEEFVVYVDKETGLWTKIECDGITEIKINDYSFTRSYIPAHKKMR